MLPTAIRKLPAAISSALTTAPTPAVTRSFELGELELHHARVERLVRLRPEYGRKERGLNAAQKTRWHR